MAVVGPQCILLPKSVCLSSLPLSVAPTSPYLCISPSFLPAHLHRQRRRPRHDAPPLTSPGGAVVVSTSSRIPTSSRTRGCDVAPDPGDVMLASRQPAQKMTSQTGVVTGSKRTDAMLKDRRKRSAKSRRHAPAHDDGQYPPLPLITIPSLTLSAGAPPPGAATDQSPSSSSSSSSSDSASLLAPSLGTGSSRLLTSSLSPTPAAKSSSMSPSSSGSGCSLFLPTGSARLGTPEVEMPRVSPLAGCFAEGYSVLGISPRSGHVTARPSPVPAAERSESPQLTLLRPGSADLEGSAMKGWPLLFHQTHSDNIQLSLDRRRAKRFESFCKGICFSNRPIAVNERVYLKFSEVSTSWSGVVRFGLTSHDPTSISGPELPRYACPDLTNKAGYWAKAVPERFAEQANTLYFYVTRNGDVMFGLNNEDKGLFFSGVNTSNTLWGLVDIYGNSTSMEFVDGRQLNNLSPSSGVPSSDGTLSPELMQAYAAIRLQQPSAGLSPGGHSQSMPSLPAAGAGAQAATSGSGLPVRFYTSVSFTPMHFHTTMGRNVCLSADKTVAVRLVEEYCNGYVFTARPLRPGEHMVIQILSVDTAFVGGLAFGMTACDPLHLNPQELPDDSDLLLDRPEYWVVNKDVCSTPVVGDELSFHLTDEGEVRYGKNGHHITSLMHVDKTLPLWAFFDVYGSTQKLKSLGMVSGHLAMSSQHRASIGSGSGLTVALPPPRPSPSPGLLCGGTPGPAAPASPAPAPATTPPPRPPPPRGSPAARPPPGGHHTPSSSSSSSPAAAPPSLPPKQFRPLPAPPPPPGTMLQPTPAGGGLGAVPPAVHLTQPPPPAVSPAPPPVAPRTLTFTAPATAAPAPARPTLTYPAMLEPPPPGEGLVGGESEEAMDNATNECSVCFENAVDCVLYTCGHMCLCYDCAVDIKENQSALCPICRQAIKDIIKIYRS